MKTRPAHPVSLADIDRAAATLEGVVSRTPLLENADVNAMLGGRLLLKALRPRKTRSMENSISASSPKYFRPAEIKADSIA